VPSKFAKPSREPATYQLKITLMGISPPIWRRIQVPGTILLSELHDVIQAGFGWTDTHLHHFERDGTYWSEPDDEFEERKDERKAPLRKVLLREGDGMTYTYDFGDNWRHRILLEKIIRTDTPGTLPICVDGKRRRPPEDVGGPSGYEEFLKVTVEPGHEDSGRFRGWAGESFHAEEFDLDSVNRVLQKKRWSGR
jgi:Plasmid pRiA4b ORF-3-like protein